MLKLTTLPRTPPEVPPGISLVQVAIGLIVLAAGWRILAAHAPSLANFSPMMALTFCIAVYFRDKRLWLVPFAALTLSGIYLNRFYGAEWSWLGMAANLACFAVALPAGALVRDRKSWPTLIGGVLACSLLFFVGTNTSAWFSDPYYAKSAGGWFRAMTIGHPGYAPTIWFFRNTILSDLVFTAGFVIALEMIAQRCGRGVVSRIFPASSNPHAVQPSPP